MSWLLGHATPLSVLIALAAGLLTHKHPTEDRALLALGGIHLLGLLALPELPGPAALHLGLWDGIFALALAQLTFRSSKISLTPLLPTVLVASGAHLVLTLAPAAPPAELSPYAMHGIGLLGFTVLALHLQPRATSIPMSLALACGLLGWTGPDQFWMIGLKFALVLSLLQMQLAQRRDALTQFETALVQAANQLELPFRLTAQALFHVPVPLLLVQGVSREVLYANGPARATLSGSPWSRGPLNALFLELHPTGPQQEEGLVLDADGLIQRVLLHTIPAPGEAGPLEIVSLSPAALSSDQLVALLIDGRAEVQGSGRCITDGRFFIAGASAGWQQHFGRLDRYFQSGSVWDKLRMAGTQTAALMQGELELERDRRTVLQIDLPHRPALEVRASGFRDSRAELWYLFEVSVKETDRI